MSESEITGKLRLPLLDVWTMITGQDSFFTY